MRRSAAQMVMSKLERRNQNRQRQLHKSTARGEESKIFDGRKGATRNVLVVPLCANTDSASVIGYLNASIDLPTNILQGGLTTVK